MINEALTYTVTKLNTFLGAIADAAVLGNIAFAQDGSTDGAAMMSKVVLSLINVEQDRMSQDPLPYRYQGSSVFIQQPAVHLNLYLLFSANYESYPDALTALDKVVEFFQYTRYFGIDNAPDLPAGLDRLIFDMFSVDLDLVHHLWSMLGSKYIPSVVYKMRMISIQHAERDAPAPMITKISTVENIK
jgi:hypothetical protein